MPRPTMPFLSRERSRHGKTVWYVRRKGKRMRIKSAYGTPAFHEEYQAALAGKALARGEGEAAGGTLAWAIGLYRKSSEWSALSPATRKQREAIFRGVIANGGEMPLAKLTRQVLIEGREERQATPEQANCFLKAMRGFVKWAVIAEKLAVDPSLGVTTIKTEAHGFHAWSEIEVERFEARWPIGTRERLAFDLLLYTGLRRGDAVRLGRQHVRDGIFRIKTEKTGTEVIAPVLPVLARSIAASPTGDLAFIAGARGEPLTKESFGNWFRGACRAAGVPGVAHGLRKAGATRAAMNGATVSQLNAIFGWTGTKMAAHYTESADRARMARAAMSTLNAPEGATGPENNPYASKVTGATNPIKRL